MVIAPKVPLGGYRLFQQFKHEGVRTATFTVEGGALIGAQRTGPHATRAPESPVASVVASGSGS